MQGDNNDSNFDNQARERQKCTIEDEREGGVLDIDVSAQSREREGGDKNKEAKIDQQDKTREGERAREVAKRQWRPGNDREWSETGERRMLELDSWAG